MRDDSGESLVRKCSHIDACGNINCVYRKGFETRTKCFECYYAGFHTGTGDFITVYLSPVDGYTFNEGCELVEPPKKEEGNIRTFVGGATRDNDKDKLDFEGFLSPLVLERYATYLHKHRIMRDGTMRNSDNWQSGIPLSVYIKSAWRHFFDWWKEHRNLKSRDGIEDAIAGLMFNCMGYLHELLRKGNSERNK